LKCQPARWVGVAVGTKVNIDTIGVAPWMAWPQTQAVITALEARGLSDCARFVGGCVRNTVMGKPIDDIDIATVLTPDEVIEALAAAGLRSIPTGVDHGTVTALSGGRPYEITTLRRDVSTDGRRAVVAFTQDWDQDAQRRDFRFNTLYADIHGRIYDSTGEGINDAREGRVVFVSDPETRIREDYLRILRFFRFHAWYGRGEADQDALAACEALKGGIESLAAERIQKEVLKLLAADDPRQALRLMAATGVLSSILPAVKSLARLDGLITIETEQLFENDPELRLAALIPEDPKIAAQVAEDLRLSNAQKERLVRAVGPSPRLVSWMSPRETRRVVYELGLKTFSDRVKLAWAASERSAATPQWRGLLALGESWTPPAFPLTGDEVLKAGVPKGPMVGQVMREVELWWIDQDFIEDRFSIIERLKAVVQGMVF
jgi:poly(A) polymerase